LLQGFARDEYIRPGSVHGVLIVRVPRATLPLLDLLNVKYVLRHVDGATAAAFQGRPDAAVVAPGLVIFTNPGVLPRVLDAYEYQVLHEPLSILRELIRPGHDPRRQVILEETPDVPAGSLPPAPVPGPPADLRISSYAATRVVIHARFARPGFLVLNDVYYPAWTATVDGRPARIYRANYLFRAVIVPAGDHDVRFVYRDRLFEAGARVSGLTLIAGLVSWLADRRRRRARVVEKAVGR
jgi:membrane protein YfhO